MNNSINRLIIAMALLAGIATSMGCKSIPDKKHLRIALSWGSENYINWVHRGDSTVEIINMKEMDSDSALKELATCDGIVFTGGEDVAPYYYGKEADSARCKINAGRDTLEFLLFKESMRLKMPVLGICRGQQLLNVAFGGTLIVDIPADRPGDVKHQIIEDYLKCFHTVTLEKNSLLHTIAGVDTGLLTVIITRQSKNWLPGCELQHGVPMVFLNRWNGAPLQANPFSWQCNGTPNAWIPKARSVCRL